MDGELAGPAGPGLVELLARLVRRGRVYDLSQSMHSGVPVFAGHVPFQLLLHHRHGDRVRPNQVSFANEVMVASCHTSTHLDALGHFSQDGQLHGGRPVAEVQCQAGLTALGIEETPPVLRRGILLDVAGCLGREHLPAGHGIDADQLAAAAGWAGVSPAPGDVVLVRTGWIRHWHDPDRFLGREGGYPGVNPAGAAWLTEQGCYMTGSDTVAYEVAPPQGGSVHAQLLVHAGIQIIENLNLDSLAAERAYEFLFVALPLRIVGATASPIRPVAIC